MTGPQRAPVLPSALRERGTDDAHRVHSHRGARMPEVWSDLQEATRALHHHPRQGARLRRPQKLVRRNVTLLLKINVLNWRTEL